MSITQSSRSTAWLASLVAPGAACALALVFGLMVHARVSGEEPQVEASPVAEATTDDQTSESSAVVAAGGDNSVASSEVQNVSFESVPSHSLAMTVLHNRYRRQAGLADQTVDPELTRIAQRWAEHMASVGSMYHGGGEQIIAYSGGDRSYDAGFRLWLNSSPHRAWLYSRGDRCGFGYSIGRNGCAYYAGAFGSSASSYSTVTTSDSEGSYYTSSNSTGRRGRWFRRRG